MRFPIRLAVYSSMLGVFLLSGVAFAAQGAAGMKEATGQCVKRGKILPNVKTIYDCDKQGGAWVMFGTTNMGGGSFGKNKAMMPPDPLEKNKAMRPPDPLEKNKAMPPAARIAPAGGQ